MGSFLLTARPKHSFVNDRVSCIFEGLYKRGNFEREILFESSLSPLSLASVHEKRWSKVSGLGSKNRQRIGKQGGGWCKFKTWGAG